MRKGELLGLKWKDVNFDSRVILVEQSKNNERRAIPMNGVLLQELLKLPRYGEYVFSNPDGRPFSDVSSSFRSAVKAAGIRDFTFHDTRHTCASHLVMSGAGLQTVQEILGHKSIRMTMRYSHLSMTYKQEAVNDLGARMSLTKDQTNVTNTAQKGLSDREVTWKR